MSDTPKGPDWWQASNQKWYPPDAQPGRGLQPPPPPQKQGGGCLKGIGLAALIGFGLLVLLIIILAVAIGGSDEPGKGGKDNPAAADVKLTGCAPSDNEFLGQVATGTVTNHSSKPSTYFVEIVFESADGTTQLDSTFATLNELQPGQSAPFEAASLKSESKVEGAKCRVADVTRTAS